jgi:hypothetical protein
MIPVAHQGRYFSVLSFVAALLVALAVAAALRSAAASSKATLALGSAIALVAVGDQVVGSFVNNGWECRRDLAAPVARDTPGLPETALERRLAELAAQHRAKAPPGGSPPSVVCEYQTGPQRYLGCTTRTWCNPRTSRGGTS